MKTLKNKNLVKPASPVTSENGSAIVAALLVLVLLTIFGITSLTTTDSDLQVVSGERNYLQDFFVAESAGKEGARWLSDRGVPPDYVNTNADPSYEDYVKNFGDSGTADDYNDDLDDGTADGKINEGTSAEVDYWYSIEDIVANRVYNVPGEAPGSNMFWYESTANADRSQEIHVELSKIYRTGY
jgi:hypothetical protein